MSRHRDHVPAGEAVFVGVGVPSGQREIHLARVIRVLDQAGYRAMEMDPDTIVAQGAHILQIRAAAAQAELETDNEQETVK